MVRINSDGYIRVYDPNTNTFDVYTPDGTTKTFFKPTDGQAYFDRQRDELVSGGVPNNGGFGEGIGTGGGGSSDSGGGGSNITNGGYGQGTGTGGGGRSQGGGRGRR